MKILTFIQKKKKKIQCEILCGILIYCCFVLLFSTSIIFFKEYIIPIKNTFKYAYHIYLKTK